MNPRDHKKNPNPAGNSLNRVPKTPSPCSFWRLASREQPIRPDGGRAPSSVPETTRRARAPTNPRFPHQPDRTQPTTEAARTRRYLLEAIERDLVPPPRPDPRSRCGRHPRHRVAPLAAVFNSARSSRPLRGASNSRRRRRRRRLRLRPSEDAAAAGSSELRPGRIDRGGGAATPGRVSARPGVGGDATRREARRGGVKGGRGRMARRGTRMKWGEGTRRRRTHF